MTTMRTRTLVAAALAAAPLCLPAAAQQANSPYPAFWGGTPVRTNVTTLVSVGKRVSGAAALLWADKRRHAESLDELLQGGYLSPDDLQVPPIAKPGSKWRLSGPGGRTVEIPLSTRDTAGQECKEVSRQSGPTGSQFSCALGNDGVVFRFVL